VVVVANNENFTINVKLQFESIKYVPESMFDIEKENRGASILIVDDSRLQCKLLQKMLNGFDLVADIAYDGFDAIEMMKQKNGNYKLVLLDIIMPRINGIETAKFITKTYPYVPMLGITANAFSSDMEEMIANGARQVLTKPIDRDQLMQALHLLNIIV
jgi:CheY-like chemotaxis protein